MTDQPAGWSPPPEPPAMSGGPRWKLSRGVWVALGAAVVLIAGGVAAGAALSGSSKPKATKTGQVTLPAASTVPSTVAPATGGGYLAAGSNAAIFLQWNDNAGQVQGTAQVTSLTGQPPNESVSAQTVDVTGTITASTISLSFNGSPLQFGTVSGNNFTINFPQQDGTLAPVTFTRSPTTAYNQAVEQLNAEVAQANSDAAAAQARQQAEQQASRAAQTVLTDISSMAQAGSGAIADAKTLSKDVASEGNDVTATLKLAQQVESETGQNGTGPGSSTCGDAESDGGDAQSVAGDSQSVVGDAQVVTSDINSLKQAISGIQSDFAAYQAALSNVAGYAPIPAPAASDVTTAVKNANAAIATAVSTANSYISQANSLVTQAFGYVAQAFAAANCGSPPSAPQPQPGISASGSG